MPHRWHFFRAGGVDQVSLRGHDDVFALAELDQKLWVALAMPTRDVDIDPATMDLLDPDKDGRVRVPDILAAVSWIKDTWSDARTVLDGGDTLALDAIKEGKVRSAAKRILADLGKSSSKTVALGDAKDVVAAFTQTTLNGDGVVIPESAEEGPTRETIRDVIATVGSVPDRSGKPGADQAKLDAFFAEVTALAAWSRSMEGDKTLRPLGDRTDAAASALAAVADKVEDYFTRCRLAAFDPQAAGALNPRDADFAAISAGVLSPSNDVIAQMPLARVEPARALPLAGDVNPAWSARLETFAGVAVEPLLGARTALSEPDYRAVVAKLGPYLARRGEKPPTAIEKLGMDRVRVLDGSDQKQKVEAVIAADRALEAEYGEIEAVEKALRLQRDFGRILRNFVNFSDFYSDGDGAFQNGTLYIDGRALHLCVPVSDAGKHGALAGMSAAYLAYCDIKRGSATRTIACAVTNGDADNLMIGRNGIFYDRDGNDWDASISKIVANPISVREAFFAPYKKLVRMIEDQVNKRAAAADSVAQSKIDATAATVAAADKAAIPAPAAAAPAPAADAPRKVDVGTVAAIGVAIGGIGALVVGVLSTFLGLGMWMPVGILSLLLLISGPSMILAWMKLRQRNLGPILDANGWAINGRARINVSFGAALTDLAKLPPGSKRSFDDPYADKGRPWRLYLFLIVIVLLAATWYVGKLDAWLPASVKSTHVLGESAPAYQKPTLEVAVPVPATPTVVTPTKP